jgi:hypothetical protein
MSPSAVVHEWNFASTIAPVAVGGVAVSTPVAISSRK